MADEVVQEGPIETQTTAGDAELENTTKALEAQAAAVGETSAAETPAPAAEKPSTDARFAAKFAALSRKERAANAKVKAAEQRLAEIEAQIAAKAAKPAVAPQEDLETRLLKDPFNTLKGQGLDFETLTKMALNDGKLTPELQMQLMRKEIEKEMTTQFHEKYGKKIEEYEQRIAAETAQKQQAAEAAAIGEFKTQIKTEIESEKDNFELLLAEGAEGIDLVYNVMDAHYQETGKILSKKEAAKFVEAELLEELQKSTKLSKVKKLLEAEVQKTQAKGKPASPTLTNNMAQVQSTGKRFLSDEDSKREAAKLIKWVES